MVKEEQDSNLHFLDVLLLVNEEGFLKTYVCRKSTNTDQYLYWSSNHHLEHKRLVAQMLLHWADKLVSEEGYKKKVIQHVKKVLGINGYEKWIFDLPKKNEKNAEEEENPTHSTTTKEFPVGIQFVLGLSDSLQCMFNSHGTLLPQAFQHPKITFVILQG